VSLSAYFDASGHPSHSKFLVVSGLIASVDQWILWKKQWDAILLSEKVKAFHAADCNAAKREFLGWDEIRIDWFLRRLAATMQGFCKFSISNIINLADYRKLDKKYPLTEGLPPYALSARACMAEINRWKKIFSPDSPVEIFFDQGEFQRGKFIERMRHDGLPDPIFRDHREVVAIQAADFLAWEEHYELKRLQARPNDAIRPVFQMLLEIPFVYEGNSYHGQYNAEDLEGLINAIGIPPRK
jgi:Protein of unknown function (DUF3800)